MYRLNCPHTVKTFMYMLRKNLCDEVATYSHKFLHNIYANFHINITHFDM